MASIEDQYEMVVNSATSSLIFRKDWTPRLPGFFSISRTPFS
jgi:hypothetical protein